VRATALDPALHRAVLAARDKRERRGAVGDATVNVAHLRSDEALALDSLLSPRRPILPGRPLSVALSVFEAALRACGIEPRSAYEQVGGRPVRDLRAEDANRRGLRVGFREWLLQHPVMRSYPALAPWTEDATRHGRVHADLKPVVERALWILAALPSSNPIQRTVLAARLLEGDPHALDVGTSLHGLTISLLAAAAELDPSTPARDVWAAWNVLVDPVSSNVAALNLPPLGDGVGAALVEASRGGHVLLTYGQLAAAELRWPAGSPCFTCENPSVLVAAEQAVGSRCPPLVCTSGYPSDATRLLLSAVHAAGAPIFHHGDFDEAGVQILRDLEHRYGAVPWRFDLVALREATSAGRFPLRNPHAATLEAAVAELDRAVPEELVIDDLIADLREADAGCPAFLSS
jgi:uncharacterized protein (TIGR02679 family)